MRPLRWRVLAGVGLAAGALTYAAATLALRGGASPFKVAWTTLPVGLVLAGAVLALAWTVRQVKTGARKRIDPLRAVRTALLAQACAYSGVLLAGVYGAYGLVLVGDWSHVPRREAAIAAGLAAIGGLVMAAAGIVGEWWCRIGPDDEPEATKGVEPGVAH